MGKRAYGANAVLRGAFEVTEGTAPAAGWYGLPFKSFSLGAEKPLETDPLLGQGRDAQDPTYGAITDAGDVDVPLDVRAIGWWLTAIFGPPVTVADSPSVGLHSHRWRSGGTVPTVALEIGHTKIGDYRMHTLCKAGGLSFEMARTGGTSGKVDLIAQREHPKTAVSAVSGAGSYALTRFSSGRGGISLAGQPLGLVTKGAFTYSNALQAVESIRADGLIDGVDETEATCTGSVTVRYSDDHTLADAGSAEQPVALRYGYTVAGSAGFALTFDLPRVFFPVKKQPISGPGGIEASFDWQAAYDPVAGHMLAVTLINDVAGYPA